MNLLEWFARCPNTRDEVSPIARILASPKLRQIIGEYIFMVCHQLQGYLSQLHIWSNNIIIYLLVCINKFPFLLRVCCWTILNITNVTMTNQFNLSFDPITLLMKEQWLQQVQIAPGPIIVSRLQQIQLLKPLLPRG